MNVLSYVASMFIIYHYHFKKFTFYLFLSGQGLHCCARFSLAVLSGELLSCCGAQALGAQASVAVTRRLQSPGSVAVVHGLVAQRHVGSSQTRDQIHVPCTGRQILNPWATQEFHQCLFIMVTFTYIKKTFIFKNISKLNIFVIFFVRRKRGRML